MHSFGQKDPNRKKDQDRKHHADQLREPASADHSFVFDLFLFEQRNQIFVDCGDIRSDIACFSPIVAADCLNYSRSQFDSIDFALFDEVFEIRVGNLLGRYCLIVNHVPQSLAVTDDCFEDQDDDDGEECKSEQGVVVEKIIIILIVVWVIVGVVHCYPLCRPG